MTSTSTEVLAELRRAKTAADDANQAFIDAAKNGIKEGLIDAFRNPDVQNVIFGVSTEEYNDENAGQGTYGPLVNSMTNEEYEHDDSYELFYNRGYNSRPSEASLLADVLSTAGWEYAGPALGLGTDGRNYGSAGESAFVAVRHDSAPGGYLLTEHERGY